jgi:outer membrane protein TolC
VLALVPLAFAAPAKAPARPTSLFGEDLGEALAAALEGLAGEPLTLDDALARALDSATDVRRSEAELRAAEGTLTRERGSYDPILFADFDVTREDTPSASPFAGADVLETKARSGTAGARLRLPLGTELEARLSSTHLETNSAFAALEPEVTARGELFLRQPLLRGFGPAANVEVSAADQDRNAAVARYEDARRTVVSDVVTSYWDLYAAERDLAVQEIIVQQAQAFLDEAQRRADAGLVGPAEVATARVFLSDQQLDALDKEERLDEVSDRLVSLMGGDAPAERWHAASEPAPLRTVVPDEDQLLARALEHNAELRALRAELDAAEARVRGARWDRLPRLDLLGSVAGNGLSGEPQPVDFNGMVLLADEDGGVSEAVREALGGDYPAWSVGLSVELPLFFREGRGERNRLEAERVRAELNVLERERELREDVRARHRELSHGLRRLELARGSVDASLEQVRIGLIEYENGRTTAFELVRLGADLASSQERYSDALVRTAKAAAELERLAPGPGSIPPSKENR